MRIAIAVLVISLTGLSVLAQGPPTLRIVTEVPNLPSELFYGDIRVKPLRLRPGTNTPITINDADFFVYQQYVDFLSRMPDQNGFAFWQGEITSCGANPQCVELKRIVVSAAFFISVEFQETGYLVYRIHKSAFGNLAGLPVPVRRESFMPETRTIGNGVVVLQPGWEQVLENNKQAFLLAFVQRPEFQSAYPAGMTADAFVTKLNTNAGDVLSSTEKSNLVATLSADPTGAATRAAVLRAVAENANLQQREFNKAFVLMQYFGYLRRNPNDPPESTLDFQGYNFWLTNFVEAEMVKAFITSSEYRGRF